MTIRLRVADPQADFPRIAELIMLANRKLTTAAMVHEWERRTHGGQIRRRWVATDDSGSVIGYSIAIHESWAVPGEFYLWMTVDPAHRNSGVGTALYQETSRFAIERGATGDRYVGLAAVGYYAETNSCHNMITGVLPEYRSRGIGLALKLIATRYARSCGAATIDTDNDSRNEPMLAINRKLGYQPQPGFYKLTCSLA